MLPVNLWINVAAERRFTDSREAVSKPAPIAPAVGTLRGASATREVPKATRTREPETFGGRHEGFFKTREPELYCFQYSPLVLVACCTSRESLMLPLVLWFSWLFIRLHVAVATGRDPTTIRRSGRSVERPQHARYLKPREPESQRPSGVGTRVSLRHENQSFIAFNIVLWFSWPAVPRGRV